MEFKYIINDPGLNININARINIFILTIKISKKFKKLEEYLKDNKINYFKVLGFTKENLNKADPKYFTKFCKLTCTNSVKGCGISHLYIHKFIEQHREELKDISLVIEDDTFVDFKNLSCLVDNIKENYTSPGIIQLIGNTILKIKSKPLTNVYSLNNYKIHFLLGAYLTNIETSKIIVEKLKINYHIDFMLNTLDLENFVIEPNLAIQTGWDNSSMITQGKLFPKYYTLAMPLFKIPFLNIVITFNLIILILLLILINLIISIPILFFIYGILVAEFIELDLLK